jgi:hypothetical protein
VTDNPSLVQCRCGNHYDLAEATGCPACGISPQAPGQPLNLSPWEAGLLRQLVAKDADQQETAGNPEAAMARRALAVRLFHHTRQDPEG